MTAWIAFAAGLTLGVVVGAVSLAFWIGAFRRSPAEQAAEDAAQAEFLRRWATYEEHA